MEHFLFMTFNYFYIGIWSYMKLEDVLEVLPMLVPKNLLDLFVFIWGREQCSKTCGEISFESHYYLMDLKRVYYACRGLPYGKGDQTFLINNEPNKALQNLNWGVLYLESLKGQMLSNNKVQWLHLASCLWPPLVELPLDKMVQVYYDYMVKYFKPHLSSSLKNH